MTDIIYFRILNAGTLLRMFGFLYESNLQPLKLFGFYCFHGGPARCDKECD